VSQDHLETQAQEDSMISSLWERTAGVVATIVLGMAVAASAQTQVQIHHEGPLATMIPEVMFTNIVLDVGAAAAAGVSPPHDAHFFALNDLGLGRQVAATAAGVNRGLVSQLATFPLGTSSGGFTWKFDESAGTYSRASQSFGPSFAERALTVGRNRFSLAFNYQHTTFDSFEGQSLDDGSIRFYLPHTDCCPAPAPNSLLNLAFEGDVMETALTIDAKLDTFTVFATYGITNNWDIGVAIPISQVELDLTLAAEILRFSTQANPLVHQFPDGSSRRVFVTSGSASGLGDVLLRTKYQFYDAPSVKLAAALDLRLPTGDADDLLGTGTTQGKLYAILSTGNERFSQHVNFGYTFSGAGEIDRFLPSGAEAGTHVGGVTIGEGGGRNGNFPNPQSLTAEDLGGAPAVSEEVNFAAGIEWAATPRVTVIGDLVGRSLRDAGQFELLTKQVTFNRCLSSTNCAQAAPGGPLTATSFEGRDLQELQFEPGNVSQFYGTAGVKFNPGGNFLVGGSVMFPLNDRGLRSKFTTVIGVEYAF
jgi:hypothetical protein